MLNPTNRDAAGFSNINLLMICWSQEMLTVTSLKVKYMNQHRSDNYQHKPPRSEQTHYKHYCTNTVSAVQFQISSYENSDLRTILDEKWRDLTVITIILMLRHFTQKHKSEPHGGTRDIKGDTKVIRRLPLETMNNRTKFHGKIFNCSSSLLLFHIINTWQETSSSFCISRIK